MDKIKCDVIVPVDFIAPAIALVEIHEGMGLVCEYSMGMWTPICAVVTDMGVRPLPSCFSLNDETLKALNERMKQTQNIQGIMSDL